MTALTEQAKALAEGTADVEWKHPSLASALVAALADLTVVEKGRTANTGSYSYGYADLGDIVKATRPVLALHGVVALQMLGSHGDGLAVTTVLLHESGDSLTSEPFSFPHGKDAQATGSWVTYSRRYALLAALGLATGEDDDGAAAKRAEPPKAHPLRARVATLSGDAGTKLWAHFLGKAGIEDADADAILTDEKAWREWLEQGIATHEAGES